jgi:hypothetical protein
MSLAKQKEKNTNDLSVPSSWTKRTEIRLQCALDNLINGNWELPYLSVCVHLSFITRWIPRNVIDCESIVIDWWTRLYQWSGLAGVRGGQDLHMTDSLCSLMCLINKLTTHWNERFDMVNENRYIPLICFIESSCKLCSRVEMTPMLILIVVGVPGSHGDEYEDGCLVGCCALWSETLTSFY